MEFIWGNKGSLPVVAARAAFLADPEPFLDGTKDITQVVAENAVRPSAADPRELAMVVVRRLDWTALVACTILIIGILA